MTKLYECDICGGLHRWEYNGDCRSDADRFADLEDFALRTSTPVNEVEAFTMDERVDVVLQEMALALGPGVPGDYVEGDVT